MGNALLPDVDPNPSHAGIQKIDRRTVTELREIPAAFWNTADPLEFERWLPVEALFEAVFTVDADAVARYAARDRYRP